MIMRPHSPGASAAAEHPGIHRKRSTGIQIVQIDFYFAYSTILVALQYSLKRFRNAAGNLFFAVKEALVPHRAKQRF